MTVLALLRECAGEAQLHWQTVRRLCEAGPVFFFRFGRMTVIEERLGDMKPERGVVGCRPQRFTQGIQSAVPRNVIGHCAHQRASRAKRCGRVKSTTKDTLDECLWRPSAGLRRCVRARTVAFP